MNCTEAEELLGAFALDALDDRDRRRMEAHLAGCTRHAAALTELQGTAAVLTLSVDEVQPRAELRQRILTRIAAGQSEPAEEARPVSVTMEVEKRHALRVWRWAPRPAHLAVAAALLVTLGLGGVIGYLVNQTAQPLAYTFQGDPSLAPGAEARLIYFKDRRQAVLAVSGLPRLTDGQVYEMWLIKGGVPVDQGISAGTGGSLGAQMSADLSTFDQLAITIEPGEQRVPTTTPILIGRLHSSST